MSRFESLPFTNHLGQKIEVGENVIAVTTGYSHRVNVRKAVYLGRRGNSPTVMVAEQQSYWDTPNGRYQYGAEKMERRTVMRRRTLPGGRIYLTR